MSHRINSNPESGKTDELPLNIYENIIIIELLGEQFKFRAEENSAVDPNDIAAYLMKEVQQVEDRFPEHARKSNKLVIMVMAALNIAKQHVELKGDQIELHDTISARTESMIRMIDSCMKSANVS